MDKRIVAAATTVLIKRGLERWSIGEVAREAGCAKGLVHYHLENKSSLLAEVAGLLEVRRSERRIEALRQGGTGALDRLWRVLMAEVSSGEFAAWLSLVSLRDSTIRSRATRPRGKTGEFARAVSEGLELEALPPDQVGSLESRLTGLQLELWCGAAPAAVEEGYHRLWLELLA